MICEFRSQWYISLGNDDVIRFECFMLLIPSESNLKRG